MAAILFRGRWVDAYRVPVYFLNITFVQPTKGHKQHARLNAVDAVEFLLGRDCNWHIFLKCYIRNIRTFCIVFTVFFIKRSLLMSGHDPTAILSWHLFPVLLSSIELNYSKQMFHLMWIASENSLVWTIVWALLQHWNHVSKWASPAYGLLIKNTSDLHVYTAKLLV